MDRRTLSRIDEGLDSSEVAELCFLCSDVINRKRLEGISDAKGLFNRLEEKGLLNDSSFLCQLLHTIQRADLLSLLQTDCRQQEETDANPILSKYRVLLYKIHTDMTQENLEMMKFLWKSELGKRQQELSNTALDVFAEMEKKGMMSATNVDELHRLLPGLDHQLASMVQTYKQGLPQHILPGLNSIDQQRANNLPPPVQPFIPISETQPSCGGESIFSDAQPDTESSSLSERFPARRKEGGRVSSLRMSAKDTVKQNKTAIQATLAADRKFILDKVYEKELITQREYNNLKSINKENDEGHVTELVDKLMNKGEDACQTFLNLLQTDEDIRETYPGLRDVQLNDATASRLPLPEMNGVKKSKYAKSRDGEICSILLARFQLIQAQVHELQDGYENGAEDHDADDSDNMENRGNRPAEHVTTTTGTTHSQRAHADATLFRSWNSPLCLHGRMGILTPSLFTYNTAFKSEESLAEVFSWLGFRVLMCKDQTKDQMEQTLAGFAALSGLTQLQVPSMQEWSDNTTCCELSIRPVLVAAGRVMDRRTLSRIDEELDSSEVAELCFLCSDVINRKRLEGISDAKGLFLRLEEKGLLDDSSFLCQLLHIIHRADLLSLLRTDCRQQEETDANPILSKYRVLLYKIHEDMTQENLEKMKFLLTSDLGRRQLELSNTALDVFAEMEKMGLMSATNVEELHRLLSGLDQQLASMVQTYKQGLHMQPQHIRPGLISIHQQRANSLPPPVQPFIPISETQPSCGGESIFSDAQPDTESSSLSDETEYYPMTHNPRGLCVIINNEIFFGPSLKNRQGTQEDEKTLTTVFRRFGFEVVVHNNLTAEKIRHEIRQLGERNFLRDDALVIAILSHGEKGCIFGSDETEVRLRELTEPFRCGRAPTLAGKPKLFFIQACQGNSYQIGSLPCPPTAIQEEEEKPSRLEEDAGRVQGETVPWDADFLLGMATVSQCKSFRNTSTGSIYIQELCRQLTKSADSTEKDDILSVLTRVNREVSKGVYLSYKQMPEPKYTLTKKLVLRYV
ncbi:uncharacterized protein [Leuresthes tenuis]|uniref:uncharacterized protein n=1 Tax=Leuresthes tenuis TaxID=355514 RepID=UPI003B503D4E